MTVRLYAFASFVGLSGLGFLWTALQLPGSESVSTLIGPRTWPLSILVFLLALTAAVFVLLIVKGADHFIETPASADVAGTPASKGAPSEARGPALEEPHPDPQKGWFKRWRHVAFFGLIVAYTAAMETIGYLLATALFAAIATALLGERRPVHILATTGVAVVVIAVVFDRLLSIPLP